MAKLNNQQKKDWAKLLFIKENLTQKEIAEKVGISQQTMTRWVRSEKWEELKVSITITREEQLRSLYRQIAELNNDIAKRDTNRCATSAEADIISKLGNAISKLETETGLSEIQSAFTDFLNWLRKFDIEEAQRLVVLFDEFIKTKLK